MLRRLSLFLSVSAIPACGGSGEAAPAPVAFAPRADAASAGSGPGSTDARGAGESGDEVTEVLPLAPVPAVFATFTDAATGFTTDAVYDADREVVHFDGMGGSMIDEASGDAVSGWSVAGAELDWTGSRVPFLVRFGTEGGERRAYFTERGPGTICNLRFPGGGTLFISATSQMPPNP
jgi:hypothetical protein